MTADEALTAAREAGLCLDRAVYGGLAKGSAHSTGFRYITKQSNSTGEFAVNQRATKYIREDDWPYSFKTAEEAALHLAMYRAKIDAAVATTSTTPSSASAATSSAATSSAATSSATTSSAATSSATTSSATATSATTTGQPIQPNSPPPARTRLPSLSASTPRIGDTDAIERMCGICKESLGVLRPWGFAAAAETTERPHDNNAPPEACCAVRYHADCLTTWILLQRGQHKDPSCPFCRHFLHGRLQRHWYIPRFTPQPPEA